MKKLITTMIAVMVMAFSVVPAFAVSSPVATSPAGGGGKSSDSPKTGSSDILAYTLLAASAAGCGVASIALVKSALTESLCFFGQRLFSVFSEQNFPNNACREKAAAGA